ncbi:MAG: reverse transcriptase domain-containing protein [Candidatus Tectomicrobia bacterium]|nr:reverse transcriptase domain-containing protein [Candidatus Tectomicrobia bacterium]
MSPRLRAKTQDQQTLTAAWQGIPWAKVHRHVFRLQKRIYQATQRGDVRTAHKLQNLLTKSWYARLLAVRRVTQDNRGRHTAGIDGVKSLTPPQRWRLAEKLCLDSQATALRRTWIPKSGSATEKRPLGIPTQFERARQTLVRQALEPQWEAKLSPHTYGFRPGRSCWDAIGAVFQRIKFRPQHLLKVDISKCFDRIDHSALLAKLQAPSGIRRQVRAWLRSGIMEADTFTPTTAGTPQGGTVSPLLALIALHGMDAAITQVYPQARVIAYADDAMVLHPDRLVLDHCQQLLMAWLAPMGLTLNETKTRISHTLEGDQPGMDFLGFHIRQYRVGKHQSGKGPRGSQRLGYKTLIKPAKANIKEHLAELGRLIRRGQNWPQAALIGQLNPKIRGWANYYRTWVSQEAFSRLDHLTWVKLRRWSRRRHPKKPPKWVYRRYWHQREAHWVFSTPATRQGQAYLAFHRETSSLWHAKVAGNRSPYDGDWVYWSTRQGRYPTVSPRRATLLKRQKGRCAYCGLFFQHDDQLEMDHISGDRQDSRSTNLQVLHGHCHDAKTRESGEYLPAGMRDKHQNTEERSARKRARSDLEQRWAERSVHRL